MAWSPNNLRELIAENIRLGREVRELRERLSRRGREMLSTLDGGDELPGGEDLDAEEFGRGPEDE